MGKFSSFSVGGGLVLLAVMCAAQAAKDEKPKDTISNGSSASAQARSIKTALKRETLPLPGSKLGGGKSIESLRTASQTLFGYNGQNGFNGGGGGGGFNQQQFGFSPNYASNGAGGRGGFGGGFGQYNLPGGAYNVLDQSQGYYGGSPYYSNGYFGGAGFSGYPYANTGGSAGAYPFGGQGNFGGFGGGFGQQAYYPGFQGQIANRNFGFVNQGFGNPAFRNPQGGAVSAGSSGISSLPSSVQVGTGLDVGSRGFSGGSLSSGGFPSASGQQYIVGNGIGQPAFISSSPSLGFGSPYGMYTPGIPGGLYRAGGPNSIFGPYSLSGSPSPPTSRPSSSGATRLQTSGPNRFYTAGPAYAPSSRERLYRFTSSNES